MTNKKLKKRQKFIQRKLEKATVKATENALQYGGDHELLRRLNDTKI